MTPRALRRTLAGFRRTLSLCVLAVALAGALTTVAVDRAEAADGVWACSVPAGLTYDTYRWDVNFCSSGNVPTSIYYVRTPADGLGACSVPEGFTWDIYRFSTLNFCSRGNFGGNWFHLRKPADGLWACSVPAGFTWDRVLDPSASNNLCSAPSVPVAMYRLRSLNTTPTTPTTPTSGHDRMSDNAELFVNKFLQSDNGRYRLYMQSDGNLVLYYQPNGHAVWASNTAGRPASHLAMQGDGNLVIYSTTPGEAIWWTRTEGHPHATLIVQNDGNVVIYDANGSSLWSTGTRGRT